MPILNFTDHLLIAAQNTKDAITHFKNPKIRLGVTGLSRSGKTVFITALIHHLTKGQDLPFFEIMHEGRLIKVELKQQPDDDIPRFNIEQHVKDLIEKRIWPQSTSQISELRLVLHYQSKDFLKRKTGMNTLTLDLIDYPGEWLLDLPLLERNYKNFSKDALSYANHKSRKLLSKPFMTALNTIDITAQSNEEIITTLHKSFTNYLKSCRESDYAFSTLPPGRFLMPGDMKGSPALTFAPLPETIQHDKKELYDIMEKRFEAYKRYVVKPFFINHFAKLDRQIILIDALSAINAGPEAITDLQNALSNILQCFKPGKASLLNTLMGQKIDKVAFVATKADHIHSNDHENLRNILHKLIQEAAEKTSKSGAELKTFIMAAIRATEEAYLNHDNGALPALIGTPIKGEKWNDTLYDGKEKIALFPGDLPKDPNLIFHQKIEAGLNFIKFRPPEEKITNNQNIPSLPHIRLGKVIEFLLGDYLK